MTRSALGRPAAWALAVVLMVSIAPREGRTQSTSDQFQQANGAYFNKRYREAIAGYGRLIDNYAIHSPVLYFNLGNAHFQLKQYGRAILSYKRGLARSPDEGLRTKLLDNLERTTEALIDREREDDTVMVFDQTHGVAYSVFHILSADLLAVVFGGLWLAFFGVLVARRLSGPSRGLRAAAIALIVPLALSAIMVIGNRVTSATVERAVVVEDNVMMREGRHPDAPASAIPEGLEVEIVDSTDPNETEIRLSNGREGWVPATSVERLF